MSGFFVLVNPKVLAKLQQRDKAFVEAYLFAKKLSSISLHPVLFNFNANREAYRLKLGVGRDKYRRLLKSAISLGLAKYYGDNLHPISHTQERKLFCVKSNHQIEINANDLKNQVFAEIIKKNIKAQNRAIRQKSLAEPTGNCTGFDHTPHASFNKRPVLSCRKAAEYLNISHTSANRLLANLKGFGLTTSPNVVQITKAEFDRFKAQGSYNIRYQNGQYLFVGANSIEYRKVGNFTNSGYSYCSNDI